MATTETVCHFYRLPREVRDLIYSYAYADGGTVKVTIRKLACEAYTSPISNTLIPRALCRNVHLDKQYLDEACPIVIRGLTFKVDDVRYLESLGRRFLVLKWNITSIDAAVRVLIVPEADADFTTVLQGFPRLRLIRLHIRLPRRLPKNEDINALAVGLVRWKLKMFSMWDNDLDLFDVKFECPHPWDRVVEFQESLQLSLEKTARYVTLKPGSDEE